MSLKPRYSLLKLLVLTALVAGGVFGVNGYLMYLRGPHHVVEPDGPNQEKEYTYTRDWHGNRTIHGPMVVRRFENQKPVFFAVIYYRQGTHVDWVYQSEASELIRSQDFSDPIYACPLSAEELREFHQARDAELQRFLAAGGNAKNQHEGIENFIITGGIGSRFRVNEPRKSAGD